MTAEEQPLKMKNYPGVSSEDKALGVKCDTEKDTLGFRIKLVVNYFQCEVVFMIH